MALECNSSLVIVCSDTCHLQRGIDNTHAGGRMELQKCQQSIIHRRGEMMHMLEAE